MPINPKESREAHPQIGQPVSAAASSSSQDSLIHCDLRGSQPVVGDRGATTGQRSNVVAFPFGEAPGLRLHRPIPRQHLENIFADRDRSISARLNGPAHHIVIEPVHDHPTARFFIGLIAVTLLIIGIAAQFA